MVNERALEADRLMMRKMKALAELQQAQAVSEKEEEQFYEQYHEVVKRQFNTANPARSVHLRGVAVWHCSMPARSVFRAVSAPHPP